MLLPAIVSLKINVELARATAWSVSAHAGATVWSLTTEPCSGQLQHGPSHVTRPHKLIWLILLLKMYFAA